MTPATPQTVQDTLVGSLRRASRAFASGDPVAPCALPLHPAWGDVRLHQPQPVEVKVEALPLEEGGVSALFDDPSFLQY